MKNKKYYRVVKVEDHDGIIADGDFQEQITGAVVTIETLKSGSRIDGTLYAIFKKLDDSISKAQIKRFSGFHTSIVENILKDDNKNLIVTTKNSIYYFERFDVKTFSFTKLSTETVLNSGMQDGDMYLELVTRFSPISANTPFSCNGFFLHEGERIPIVIRRHPGMVRDSWLATEFENRIFDVRFLDENSHELSIYHWGNNWSNNVKRIHFCNSTHMEYFINWINKKISILPGQTASMIYDRDTDRKAEGLFSPDAVNGKSIFHKSFSKDECDEEL